jgi:tetratricopeptide (TPR) repeat protein
LSEAHAVVYALLLFICPGEQNFDHDLPVFHSLLQWPLPLDLILLGGLATGALLMVQRHPLVSFSIGWFFVQLLPTTIIPRADLLSERNLYLASIGVLLVAIVLCSCVVQWLMTVLPYHRIVRFGTNGIALAFVLFLCFFTYQRNSLYHNEVSLWSDAVGKSPYKARPHNNLGHAYAMQGNWDRAIEEFRTAAQLDPHYGLAQKNLRDAYLHQVGRQ